MLQRTNSGTTGNAAVEANAIQNYVTAWQVYQLHPGETQLREEALNRN
jgi:hypothetical protein